MMNRERGQGLVEYALILVLVAIVVIVGIVLVGKLINPPQKPAIDAPLLEIVRWCESNARDSETSITSAYNPTTKKIETKPTSRSVDSPEKFITCMQSYEYRVTR